MSDFNIKIKTEAEGQGAQQTLSWIQKIKAATGELKNAYGEAGGGVKGLAGVASQAGGLIGASFAAAATAVFGLSKAVSEFAETEKVVAKLDKALAKNGLLTDENRQKYQDLASQLEETTGTADEEWTKVLAKLTQFGATPADIEKNVAAVKNLANVMDGDLNSAATLVSRALQGNFQMFARYGIQIEETGTRTEKLSKLYERLAQVGGGVASEGKTLSYYFSNLRNQISNFMEGVGGLISRTGILQFVLYGLGKSFQFVASVLQPLVPKLDGLNNGIKSSAASMLDAEAAAAALAVEIKKVKDETERANHAFEKELANLKALQSQQDEMTDAKMAQQIAMVDLDEAKGRLKPSEAVLARTGIRSAAETEKFQREKKAREDEINMLKAQALVVQKPVTDAQKEAQAADQKAKALAADEAALNKQIGVGEARLRTAMARKDEADWWGGQDDGSDVNSRAAHVSALRSKIGDASLDAQFKTKKVKELEDAARPKLQEIEDTRQAKERDLAHASGLFEIKQQTMSIGAAKDLFGAGRSESSATDQRRSGDVSALKSGQSLSTSLDDVGGAYAKAADEALQKIQRLIAIANQQAGKTNALTSNLEALEATVRGMQIKGGNR